MLKGVKHNIPPIEFVGCVGVDQNAIKTIDVSKSSLRKHFLVKIMYENRSTSTWTCTVTRDDGEIKITNIFTGATITVKE